MKYFGFYKIYILRASSKILFYVKKARGIKILNWNSPKNAAATLDLNFFSHIKFFGKPPLCNLTPVQLLIWLLHDQTLIFKNGTPYWVLIRRPMCVYFQVLQCYQHYKLIEMSKYTWKLKIPIWPQESKVAQCGKFRSLLSLRFLRETNFGNLKMLKLTFG